MDPTPWRSPNRRQALGASTATQRSTTRTSRITIVTPRRPTFAPAKNPNEPVFTSGGWWGNATAPTLSALLLSLRLYAQRRAESRPSFGRRAASPSAPHTARLHQRPSVHPTVTASPKQSETRAEVTTSDSGPDATSAPLETSAPWVKPGGISSQWCVTRTIGGLARAGGRDGSR